MNDEVVARFIKVFGKSPSSSQATGFDRIIERFRYIYFDQDYNQKLAYILATAWWESAFTLQPVREGLATSDSQAREYVNNLFARGKIGINYAIPAPNGHSYYGRGLVQITWQRNYRAIGDHLIGDEHFFYDNPDAVLEPKVATIILIRGMLDGVFTGYRLGEFINDDRCDWVGARKTVNGIDRAERLAELAERFFYVLTGRSRA